LASFDDFQDMMTLLEQKADTVYNKVWYLWDDNEPDSVGPTLSSSADEDPVSQKIFGIREAVVNVTQVPETVAQLVQDIFIERNAYPRQAFKGSITGRINHLSGMEDEPYMIKAGDTIAVADADLNAGISRLVIGEAANAAAGFVTKTEYSYGRNTLQIDVGTDDRTMDFVFARWGIGGGVS